MPYNKIILMGHLTRNPELRSIKGSDTVVANTGIAVNRKVKDREEVMFIDVTAFGRTAEIIGEYTTKGSLVLIDGRLTLQQWEKDSERKSKHVVVIENIQLLDKKGNNNADSNQSSYSSRADGYGEMSNDDVPF